MRRCIGWLDRPEQPNSGQPAQGAPPALLPQSTHNTLAPFEGAFGLAWQLPGSRVLSREGDDYSIIQLSQCALDAFIRYVDTDRLPAPGSICRD